MSGCKIYVEGQEWYGVGGRNWYNAEGHHEYGDGWSEKYDGVGYTRRAKRYRTLQLQGPYRLSQLTIAFKNRSAYRVPGYNWPAAQLVQLFPPGERPPKHAPSAADRAVARLAQEGRLRP